MERGTREQLEQVEGRATRGGGESDDDIFGFRQRAVSEDALRELRRQNESNMARAMATLRGDPAATTARQATIAAHSASDAAGIAGGGAAGRAARVSYVACASRTSSLPPAAGTRSVCQGHTACRGGGRKNVLAWPPEVRHSGGRSGECVPVFAVLAGSASP